jgi:protein phosphatase
VLPRAEGFDSGAIVCDGVGGAASGEVASRLAVERLTASLALGDGDIAQRLRAGIADANRTVRAYAQKYLNGVPSGSTVVVAVVHGARLTVGHVGDSRAYLLRDQALTRLTGDHSFVGDLVRAGKLAEADASSHPMRGSLTRAIGVEETIKPEVSEHELKPGDVVLLCTDGLHCLASDKEIAAAIGPDMARSARALIDLVNERGGIDNVSVALYREDA